MIHDAITTASDISSEISTVSGDAASDTGLGSHPNRAGSLEAGLFGRNRTAALTYENLAMFNQDSEQVALPNTNNAHHERHQTLRAQGLPPDTTSGASRISSSTSKRSSISANPVGRTESYTTFHQSRGHRSPGGSASLEDLGSMVSALQSVLSIHEALGNKPESSLSLDTFTDPHGRETVQQRLESLRSLIARIRELLNRKDYTNPDAQHVDTDIEDIFREVEKLLNLSATDVRPDIQATNRKGQTPLHRAARKADLKLVSSLI